METLDIDKYMSQTHKVRVALGVTFAAKQAIECKMEVFVVVQMLWWSAHLRQARELGVGHALRHHHGAD